MTLTNFNNLTPSEAHTLLHQCCGSQSWVNAMMKQFPFASESVLALAAESSWYNECTKQDWLEAFTHHPKIGDLESIRKKYASTQHLTGSEQAGVQGADMEIIRQLAGGNAQYEAQNDFIYLVCASGKSAAEMLRLLQDRLKNTPNTELQIAMGEQHKITMLRLKKMLPDADWSFLKVSQITTHILDTSVGKPAEGITIKLQAKATDNQWITLCQGVTNGDGRIPDLLPINRVIPSGDYKMVFETGDYFRNNGLQVFYPEVEVQCHIPDEAHYHIPLLLNPFGYSTYRGS